MESVKLNLGCGKSKLEGFVNIDSEPSCEPDLLLDFVNSPLPYADESVEAIYLFHVIEHVPEANHGMLLRELHRVLKPEGILVMSYPEFTRCAQNYLMNYRGQRDFWKATIYGLQRYPGDFHVALMDTTFFLKTLEDYGFMGTARSEVAEPYNTIVQCTKMAPADTYEQVLLNEIFGERSEAR